MSPLDFLAQLQADAEHGFNRDVGWVDDSSSVAKALRMLADE